MELQEGLKLGLFVGMGTMHAQYGIEEFRDRIGDGSWKHKFMNRMLNFSTVVNAPNIYMSAKTKGAQVAPMDNPYLTR